MSVSRISSLNQSHNITNDHINNNVVKKNNNVFKEKFNSIGNFIANLLSMFGHILCCWRDDAADDSSLKGRVSSKTSSSNNVTQAIFFESQVKKQNTVTQRTRADSDDEHLYIIPAQKFIKKADEHLKSFRDNLELVLKGKKSVDDLKSKDFVEAVHQLNEAIHEIGSIKKSSSKSLRGQIHLRKTALEEAVSKMIEYHKLDLETAIYEQFGKRELYPIKRRLEKIKELIGVLKKPELKDDKFYSEKIQELEKLKEEYKSNFSLLNKVNSHFKSLDSSLLDDNFEQCNLDLKYILNEFGLVEKKSEFMEKVYSNIKIFHVNLIKFSKHLDDLCDIEKKYANCKNKLEECLNKLREGKHALKDCNSEINELCFNMNKFSNKAKKLRKKLENLRNNDKLEIMLTNPMFSEKMKEIFKYKSKPEESNLEFHHSYLLFFQKMFKAGTIEESDKKGLKNQYEKALVELERAEKLIPEELYQILIETVKNKIKTVNFNILLEKGGYCEAADEYYHNIMDKDTGILTSILDSVTKVSVKESKKIDKLKKYFLKLTANVSTLKASIGSEDQRRLIQEITAAVTEKILTYIYNEQFKNSKGDNTLIAEGFRHFLSEYYKAYPLKNDSKPLSITETTEEKALVHDAFEIFDKINTGGSTSWFSRNKKLVDSFAKKDAAVRRQKK